MATFISDIKGAPFLIGAVAAFSIMQIMTPFSAGPLSLLLVVESALFAAAGFLGFISSKQRRSNAGFLTFCGNFLGLIADIIVHPTINGFERNLFPLEIGLHMFIAAPSIFIGVSASKFVLSLIKQK